MSESRIYPPEAIERAKDGAESWLTGSPDGYPRSWAQEEIDTKRRGDELYDDFEAPPIAGYEALEREGKVKRVGVVMRGTQERIHFRRV